MGLIIEPQSGNTIIATNHEGTVAVEIYYCNDRIVIKKLKGTHMIASHKHWEVSHIE